MEHLLLENTQLKMELARVGQARGSDRQAEEVDRLRRLLETEMRKNRDLRQKNSTVWDLELKRHLDGIMANIQRDYMLKSSHQALLEAALAKEAALRIEEGRVYERRVHELEAQLRVQEQDRPPASELDSRYLKLQEQAQIYQNLLRESKSQAASSPRGGQENCEEGSEGGPSGKGREKGKGQDGEEEPRSRFERIRQDFDKELLELRNSFSARRERVDSPGRTWRTQRRGRG